MGTDQERHISQWDTRLTLPGYFIDLFGCTEDIMCRCEAKHVDDFETDPFVRRLCAQCAVPVCADCTAKLHLHSACSPYRDGGTNPMSLSNDHYYGHVNRCLVENAVAWLEVAASCMVWSTMLVYY